jgi:hypothetical protein
LAIPLDGTKLAAKGSLCAASSCGVFRQAEIRTYVRRLQKPID